MDNADRTRSKALHRILLEKVKQRIPQGSCQKRLIVTLIPLGKDRRNCDFDPVVAFFDFDTEEVSNLTVKRGHIVVNRSRGKVSQGHR